MIEFTNSFLNDIDILLNLRVGGLIRLEYIKKMIIDNKPLYSSDRQYLENLIEKYIKHTSKTYEPQISNPAYSEFKCWNCETVLSLSSNYCPSCGVKQNKQFSNANPFQSKKQNSSFNPLYIFQKLHSYQIISVIGGLVALIPILIATSEVTNILDSFGFYSGEDSVLSRVFVAAGIFSSLLCCLAMIIPFVVKNPKKVGRILFFSSIAILITSVLVGIVGFILIMIASMIAFKKRHY